MEHTPSNTRIKPILSFCMPKNSHNMNKIVFLLCPDLKKKKKKKKDRPTDPPNFQAKRANKPFISLVLINSIILWTTCNDYEDQFHKLYVYNKYIFTLSF